MPALKIVLAASLCIASISSAQDKSSEPTTLETIYAEASAHSPHVGSGVAKRFLKSANDLPVIDPPRTIYVNPETREAITANEYEELDEESRGAFEAKEINEKTYYLTRYGTPIAYARALDFVAPYLGDSVDEKMIFDFGHGGFGHLRMLASIGAHARGVDISDVLHTAFTDEFGETPRSHEAAGVGKNGSAEVYLGSFPSDEKIVEQAGVGYDLFMSKNTLKLGYIHPEREVDPRLTIDLGATDKEFLGAVHRMLNEGGLFLIYNLYPKPSGPDEPYRPWADGRCPFTEEACEEAGFEVVVYNRDDTAKAHEMARSFGWDERLTLETDVLGMVTLLRKR